MDLDNLMCKVDFRCHYMFRGPLNSDIEEVNASSNCYISSLLFDPITKGIYNTQVIITTIHWEHHTEITLVIKPQIIAPFLVLALEKNILDIEFNSFSILSYRSLQYLYA